MNIRKLFSSTLLKNSLIYVVSDAINKAIPFLILPVLANYLVPASYSIVSNFAVAVTLLSVFIGFSSQGLISSTYFREGKERVVSYTGNLLILIIITAAFVALVLYVFSAQLYETFSISYGYLLLAVFIAAFNNISSINTSIWRLEEKPVPFGVYQVTQTALNVSLSLVLIILFAMDWEGRVWGIAVSALLYGIISVFILVKRRLVSFKWDQDSMAQLLKFGVPLMPHMLSLWVKTGVDRVFVTKFWGDTANGVFVAGTQFGLIVSFFILSFHNAYVPYLYKKLSEPDETKLMHNKYGIVRFTYFYLLGVLLFCVLASIGSVLFIRYFLNEHYQGATVYVPWAIFAQFFQAIYLMMVSYLFYLKKTASISMITFSCGLIQVALSYFGVQYFGPIGAMYSTVIVVAINAILVAIMSNKHLKMPWVDFGKIFKTR